MRVANGESAAAEVDAAVDSLRVMARAPLSCVPVRGGGSVSVLLQTSALAFTIQKSKRACGMRRRGLRYVGLDFAPLLQQEQGGRGGVHAAIE